MHVPHYSAMFERLLRGPRPWRFGHLLLPGGSANLGNDEYALRPGTKAPLTGTMMEVLQAVRLPDGRLLLLAAGTTRFRVLAATQSMPYSRADVVLAPDEEEVAQALDLVGAAVEEEAAAQGRMLSDAARRSAAVGAAAAMAGVWGNYSLLAARVLDSAAVIEAGDEQQAMAFGRRLIDIAAANEVLELPFDSVAAATLRCDGEPHDPPATNDSSDASSGSTTSSSRPLAELQSAWRADERALADAGILAAEAALSAATGALACSAEEAEAVAAAWPPTDAGGCGLGWHGSGRRSTDRHSRPSAACPAPLPPPRARRPWRSSSSRRSRRSRRGRARRRG